jgi:hypothetical protein
MHQVPHLGATVGYVDKVIQAEDVKLTLWCWPTQPTSFIIPFPTGDTSDFDNTDITSWDAREAVRASIPPHIMTAILPLLVLVSAQLEDRDYRHLAPALWAHHLESDDKVAAGAVS